MHLYIFDIEVHIQRQPLIFTTSERDLSKKFIPNQIKPLYLRGAFLYKFVLEFIVAMRITIIIINLRCIEEVCDGDGSILRLL